jgi:mRNA interferase MazF
MEQYSPGEILLLKFPFTDEGETRRRPALVLTDVGDDDVIVARITTHVTRTTFDVEIKDWRRQV